MQGGGRSEVRWRTRITTGSTSTGPGFLQVKKLTGILVRCPKCGHRTGVLYQMFEAINTPDIHYVKCRTCGEQTFISARVFEALVRDVLPATCMGLLQ
jgi:DNA-directed RNA polymerase subunit RPC12/RpoP